MSRTDAHIPAWVRNLNKKRRVAIHDHSMGECDLPEGHNVDPENRTRCYWSLTLGDMYENPSCGCHACTNHVMRRAERRAVRHQEYKIIEAGYLEWMDAQRESDSDVVEEAESGYRG